MLLARARIRGYEEPEEKMAKRQKALYYERAGRVVIAACTHTHTYRYDLVAQHRSSSSWPRSRAKIQTLDYPRIVAAARYTSSRGSSGRREEEKKINCTKSPSIDSVINHPYTAATTTTTTDTSALSINLGQCCRRIEMIS